MFPPAFKNCLRHVYLISVFFGPPSHAIDLNLLMYAIYKQDQALVSQLLERFTLEAVNQSTSCYEAEENETAGKSEQLCLLDQATSNPQDSTLSNENLYPTFFSTPLQLAAGFSTPEIVELLIGAGANTDHADQQHAGNTPLMYACRHGRLGNAKVLLSNGADPNRCSLRDWGARYPIHAAVKSGNIDVASLIIDTVRSSVNATDFFGETPLHCVQDQPEMFELLVQQGADINAVSRSRQSVLYKAIADDHPTISAKIMGCKNFDWSSIHLHRSFEVNTLLHVIARGETGHLEEAIVLLAHGLNPRFTDISGETAAHIAKKNVPLLERLITLLNSVPAPLRTHAMEENTEKMTIKREEKIALAEVLETAMFAGNWTVQHCLAPSFVEQPPFYPIPLQRLSAHAIRRDISLWNCAVQYLPSHMVEFVLGANWERFRKNSGLW